MTIASFDKILVTGCAGFIGSNLVDRLLDEKIEVIGIDNFNNYYDSKLKETNLKYAKEFGNFKLYRGDICDLEFLKKVIGSEKPTKVVHLAGRAGVRPSIENPQIYSEVNVLGTVNLLKASVDFKIKQFVFCSSSSVYGNSKVIPFREDDPCQNMISPYASSKRSAEIFVEAFYKSYGLASTVLRFFTVYGERGRPDMAPAKFTNAILKGDQIRQFGDGSSSRDYTYVGDVVEGIFAAIQKKFGFEIINLGNSHPVSLSKFIESLEKISEKKARIKILPVQKGDVEKTWADIQKAKKLLLWEPTVTIEEGLRRYVSWFTRQH